MSNRDHKSQKQVMSTSNTNDICSVYDCSQNRDLHILEQQPDGLSATSSNKMLFGPSFFSTDGFR